MEYGLSADWVGLILTAAGGVLALVQYRTNSEDQKEARKRERAVMAANELERFHGDPAIQAAMRMIDYCEVPGTADGAGASTEAAYAQPSEITVALRYHAEDKDRLSKELESRAMFKPQERQIRETIDHFLGRLERIENLIANGVISADDFKSLFSYWLQLTGEIPDPGDTLVHFDDERRRALWRYIRLYRFDGVVRLFESYGRAAPVPAVPTDPDETFVRRPERQGAATERETA